MDGRQRSQKLSLETETPPSPNCLCKENTSCITKASQGRYLHAEQKVGRSWVKGFPLMNSRFEKAGRILLRGSGLERGRSGDKRGHERPLPARLVGKSYKLVEEKDTEEFSKSTWWEAIQK